MSIKHKAYKETLGRGYSSEWNDDHIQDYRDHIDMDFCPITASLSSYWDLYSAGTGNDPAVTLVGAAGSAHAFVVFNTGGTTNNTSGMRKKLAGAVGNITSSADLPILTFPLQIVAVHNVGNVIEAGLLPSAAPPFTANQDGAYFRVNNNTLYAVTGDGAAETTTDLGAFDEYAVYRVEMLSTSVRFYVNDMVTPAATHTTNIPNTTLTIMFTIRSLNNVDSTMRIDAVGLQILRKQ